MDSWEIDVITRLQLALDSIEAEISWYQHFNPSSSDIEGLYQKRNVVMQKIEFLA
jgi:hypothetical protein